MLDGKCTMEEFMEMIEKKYAEILEKENNNSTK